MNVPLELLISSLVAVASLLVMLFAKAHRVGYLEGRLKAAEERYEALYQLYNSPLYAGPTSMPMTARFDVASHADIFGSGLAPPAPGYMPSRMLGHSEGYRNASGHMQPFPPEPSR